MSQIRRVAILGGNRIPFARSNGAYLGVSKAIDAAGVSIVTDA